MAAAAGWMRQRRQDGIGEGEGWGGGQRGRGKARRCALGRRRGEAAPSTAPPVLEPPPRTPRTTAPPVLEPPPRTPRTSAPRRERAPRPPRRERRERAAGQIYSPTSSFSRPSPWTGRRRAPLPRESSPLMPSSTALARSLRRFFEDAAAAQP
ncbi:hypothetical protein DAI22_07g008000 [Oryza sativa Japonica Group]|nr:hypothetical protein DAI22_07g008000 [Oryza sativa Japonica Group]